LVGKRLAQRRFIVNRCCANRSIASYYQNVADTPMNAELAVLCKRLGHRFSDAELLVRALTHSSWAYEQASADDSPVADRGNEQMEFLGDAVLGMVVAAWLYRHHGTDDEGRMTRMRAALVSRRNLSRIARRLDLGACLRLGRGEERSGGRHKAALLADALEAVIAALYLDGGVAAAQQFVEREILHTAVQEGDEATTGLREIEDWKSAVQEWLQARGLGRALYQVVASVGPDHAKTFTVELKLDGLPTATATASSKKQAEQQCARIALETLRSAEASKAGA